MPSLFRNMDLVNWMEEDCFISHRKHRVWPVFESKCPTDGTLSAYITHKVLDPQHVVKDSSLALCSCSRLNSPRDSTKTVRSQIDTCAGLLQHRIFSHTNTYYLFMASLFAYLWAAG